jgi:hypothetical protein
VLCSVTEKNPNSVYPKKKGLREVQDRTRYASPFGFALRQSAANLTAQAVKK